jgi:hypothetical protein
LPYKVNENRDVNCKESETSTEEKNIFKEEIIKAPR